MLYVASNYLSGRCDFAVTRIKSGSMFLDAQNFGRWCVPAAIWTPRFSFTVTSESDKNSSGDEIANVNV